MGLSLNSGAQPKLSSVRLVEGVEVYDDLRLPNHYYFLPGVLELAREGNGRPKFQMLQMRYTGTALIGDQGDREFINLVQVGIERKPITAATLKAIRSTLGRGASLDPLPVTGLEANLVLPLADQDGRYQRIGRTTGLEAPDGSNRSNWTKKTFTVRLGTHEGALLWDLIEKGRSGFSISYAYYADVVDDFAADYRMEGDSATVAEVQELLTESAVFDSVSTVHAVRSGAIPVHLDTQKFPDLLQRLDLNKGAPPAWAFLEVRCYDFGNQLRPDLAMKSIEVEATGVTGNKIRLKPIRFMGGRSQKTVHHVRFPYVIDLAHPYKYRVTEYTEEGDARSGSWKTSQSWTGLLDLTTPPDQIPYTEETVEIETDTAAWRMAGVTQVELQLIYQRDGRIQREKVSWDLTKVSGAPLQIRRFFVDRETEVRYLLLSKGGKGKHNIPITTLASDRYLHLRPRQIVKGPE